MRLPVLETRNLLTNTLFVGGFAAAALVAAACSSGPDPNDPSQMQPSGGYGYNNNGGQYAPNGGGYTNPQPTTPATSTQPAPATGGGSATPIPPAAAMAATPALQVLAGRDAQGMSADGPAFAAQFQQGQTFEQVINVAAGKCYTIVAAGVGITQLDVVVNTAPPAPLPAVPVAQSSTQGPNATVGGGGNCMRSPIPGQFKVVLKATAGAGVAVAQVFSK